MNSIQFNSIQFNSIQFNSIQFIIIYYYNKKGAALLGMVEWFCNSTRRPGRFMTYSSLHDFGVGIAFLLFQGSLYCIALLDNGNNEISNKYI